MRCALVSLQPHDLLRMERIILNMLDFGLSGPSCYTFLHLLAQASIDIPAQLLCQHTYACQRYSYCVRTKHAPAHQQLHTHQTQGMRPRLCAHSGDSSPPSLHEWLR